MVIIKNIKMKSLLFLLAFLCVGNLAHADTYYVYAKSGLTLRDYPSPTGNKLQTIPFQSAVEVFKDTLYGEPLTVKEYDISITDRWQYIRYNGQEGFVFAAYLLDLPIDLHREQGEDFNIEHYFVRNLRIEKDTFNRKYYDDSLLYTCAYEVEFKEDIHLKANRCKESGLLAEVLFTTKNVEELYVFLLAHIRSRNLHPAIVLDESSTEKPHKSIEMDTKGHDAGCYYSILLDDKTKAHLIVYCGC